MAKNERTLDAEPSKQKGVLDVFPYMDRRAPVGSCVRVKTGRRRADFPAPRGGSVTYSRKDTFACTIDGKPFKGRGTVHRATRSGNDAPSKITVSPARRSPKK